MIHLYTLPGPSYGLLFVTPKAKTGKTKKKQPHDPIRNGKPKIGTLKQAPNPDTLNPITLNPNTLLAGHPLELGCGSAGFGVYRVYRV